ncbi:MAG: hypothetical protein MI745_09040 [Pseudomonadales bacterium]|nr:hypothetical protein [Pseudomonadales bacterium]
MRICVFFAGLVSMGALALSGCGGEAVPEALKPSAAKDWTDAQVDAVVEVALERIHAPLNGAAAHAPQACNDIQVLRIRHRAGPQDSGDTDAVFMMMPGILEGANGFEYLGRQMVYVAAQQHGESIEVWGMDRRANCLEDLHAMQLAETVGDTAQAEQMLFDYYFRDRPVAGKKFSGFLESSEVPYLQEFGLALATQDMFTVMQTLMPDQADRQARLFVGGHSLGGIHTSTFLAWDQDGDASTLSDAGYANVAGAFALDSILTPLSDIPDYIAGMVPFSLGALGLKAVQPGSELAYKGALSGLNNNLVPRYTAIPNAFTPRVLALPEAIALVAKDAPQMESQALARLPHLPDIDFMVKVLHTRNAENLVFGPGLREFRYSQEALVGLLFDDHFSPIGFLGTSLGHLNGGPLAEKQKTLAALADLPFIGGLISAAYTGEQQHIAASTDYLYRWANFDQIAADGDSTYTDKSGRYVFTERDKEMSDIRDFSRSLYVGETNFTEWYFPTRIVIDTVFALPFEHAEDSGLRVLHESGIELTPRLELIGGDGVIAPLINEGVMLPTTADRRIIPGFNHLDPMFATANTSSYFENPIIPALLNFARENRGI